MKTGGRNRTHFPFQKFMLPFWKKVLFSGNFVGLQWDCDCAVVDVFLIGSPTSICFFQLVYECRITFIFKCIKSEHVIQDASRLVLIRGVLLKQFWLSVEGSSFRKQPSACATNSQVHGDYKYLVNANRFISFVQMISLQHWKEFHFCCLLSEWVLKKAVSILNLQLVDCRCLLANVHPVKSTVWMKSQILQKSKHYHW